MTAVTYESSIKTAQEIYQKTSDELGQNILTLAPNIRALNDISVKNYEEMKDRLKELTQQMVAIYPTIQAAHERGQRTIKELQQTLDFIIELKPLSSEAIDHLVRSGLPRKKIVEEEILCRQVRTQGKIELETEMNSLAEVIKRLETIENAFKIALDKALYVRGQGEKTNTIADYAISTATSILNYTTSSPTYYYLNKALKADKAAADTVQQPTDVAASTSAAAEALGVKINNARSTYCL